MKRGLPEDTPVYRTRPLPTGPLQGRYLVHEGLVPASAAVLRRFARRGSREGGHEGLVFWAGVESPPWTVLTTVVVPKQENSPQRVHVTDDAYGKAVEAASRAGVAVLAQVHSHPGGDSRHSDGDDDLVILPFEGMLSIVVPRFASDWDDLFGASVHQYRAGSWTLCDPESVRNGIAVAPGVIDVEASL